MDLGWVVGSEVGSAAEVAGSEAEKGWDLAVEADWGSVVAQGLD